MNCEMVVILLNNAIKCSYVWLCLLLKCLFIFLSSINNMWRARNWKDNEAGFFLISMSSKKIYYSWAMEAAKVYANRYHDTTMRFQGFFKLMMVWKGSVMKLIWHDLLMFILLYSTLSVTYRHILLENEPAAQYFELMCIYSSK